MDSLADLLVSDFQFQEIEAFVQEAMWLLVRMLLVCSRVSFRLTFRFALAWDPEQQETLHGDLRSLERSVERQNSSRQASEGQRPQTLLYPQLSSYFFNSVIIYITGRRKIGCGKVVEEGESRMSTGGREEGRDSTRRSALACNR